MVQSEKRRRLVQAIGQQHKISATPRAKTNETLYWSASFVGLESDPNLAKIQIGSTIYRSVPRAINAWTTTPSAGASLLVLQLGGSFLILCQQIGSTINATNLGAGG